MIPTFNVYPFSYCAKKNIARNVMYYTKKIYKKTLFHVEQLNANKSINTRCAIVVSRGTTICTRIILFHVEQLSK